MTIFKDPPHNFEDGGQPEPGQTLKLPSRPDYIRGKFAHLYHPKTTFSKSGAGDRTRFHNNNNNSHNTSNSNNFLGFGGGGGGSRFGSRMQRESTLNPNMFTNAASRGGGGSGYLGVGAPGFGRNSTMRMTSNNNNNKSGRASTMMGGRTSTMKMLGAGGGMSRGPSRMASTRAPSQMMKKRKGSIVAETISHYHRQENNVGATNRERVNARVAQSILSQSKKSTYSPSSSPTHSALKKSTNNNNSSNNNNNSQANDEISLPIPTSPNNSSNNTKELLHNLFDPDNKKNQQQQQQSFNVSVKVLPTEAPKRLSEFAEEYGVTEQEIRDANPHLMMMNRSMNKNTENSLENTVNNLDDEAEEEYVLQTDDELIVPVKKDFVVKSLKEARDTQLSEAMKKFLEAAAAKAEAEDAEDNNNNNNILKKSSSSSELNGGVKNKRPWIHFMLKQLQNLKNKQRIKDYKL